MSRAFISCPLCAFYAKTEGGLCPAHEFVKPAGIKRRSWLLAFVERLKRLWR